MILQPRTHRDTVSRLKRSVKYDEGRRSQNSRCMLKIIDSPCTRTDLSAVPRDRIKRKPVSYKDPVRFTDYERHYFVSRRDMNKIDSIS